MGHLTAHHITVLLLSLGVLLGTARILGELAQRFRQPAILGELLAGILLGPTVLGRLFPAVGGVLFPLEGAGAIARDTLSNLAIVLFLMVAGIEVDLSSVWRQGKTGCKVGMASILVPFAAGFAAAWFAPGLLGRPPGTEPLLFALFLAIALSISALPIIAKTLMDMDLYRSDLGMVAISAAVLNDLVGWIVFAVVLGLMGTPSGNGILMTITLTLAFAAFVLTVGRSLIHRALPFIQAYTRWPGGELSFAIILALIGAAFTEWIGLHAIFGAFLVGAAMGDSTHLREHTRITIDHFISSIFAPLFFAGIGLSIDFIHHFDLSLVLAILLITCFCKLAGGVLGAKWGRLSFREAWGVGFSMISVGAMGIIVGLLALRGGIIQERLFVALVIMAIGTSMMSGPGIRLSLRPVKKRRIQELLTSKGFLRDMKARTCREAIDALCAAACAAAGLDPEGVTAAVVAREEGLSTGIGRGVALPHARIAGLREPVVAVGLSRIGIDFDAPDGMPSHVIFLLLTPPEDPGNQLTLIAEIARLFRDPRVLERVMAVRKFTDFLALMRTAGHAKTRQGAFP